MFPNWFNEWLLRTSVSDHCGSIQLVDVTFHQEEAFVPFAKQALHLVQTKDPRRFRRIEQEVRYLVNSYLISGADYRRGTRRCTVDFARYQVSPSDPSYEWYLAAFACMLVHEATHGRLYSLGIPYNEATRARVERLCNREASRFATRLHSDRYDLTKVVAPVNEAYYQSYWKLSRLAWTWKILARMHKDTQGEPKQ